MMKYISKRLYDFYLLVKLFLVIGFDINKWKYSLDKIKYILDLEPNWDGYGAKAIDKDVFRQVIVFLSKYVDSKVPIPKIVPTSCGGIQVEWWKNTHPDFGWHSCYRRLEVEFMPNQDPEYSYYDGFDDVSSEGIVGKDFGSVIELFMRGN